MNKLLIATAAVALATAGTAGAADLPMKAPPMIPPPAMTWTGCYIDGGIGYGMWNQDESERITGAASTLTYTNGGRGWLGRFGVGCDYQIAPSFVIGAFGDYDFTGLKGTTAQPNFTTTGGAAAASVANEKERGSWQIGGRIGYLPYPNLMTFVSAGWTQARFNERDFVDQITGVSVGVALPQHDYNGWFLGGGTEYAVPWAGFHGLFWKTEYRFSKFRADDLVLFTTATGLPFNGGTSIANDEKFIQSVTTSLVWKFNWGGPVVARY